MELTDFPIASLLFLLRFLSLLLMLKAGRKDRQPEHEEMISRLSFRNFHRGDSAADESICGAGLLISASEQSIKPSGSGKGGLGPTAAGGTHVLLSCGGMETAAP